MYNLMMGLRFTESKVNSNLYFKIEGGIPVMILLYVNDMFMIGEDELIEDAKRRLATKFKMKYLGMMYDLLGMEVWESAYMIFLGQGKYAVDILKKFGMLDCKATSTP